MPVGGLVRSTRKRNKFTTPFKAKYRRGQNIAIKLKTMDKGPSSMEWNAQIREVLNSSSFVIVLGLSGVLYLRSDLKLAECIARC